MGDWLVGGGEMGNFVRVMDWSRTPLGSMDTWPQSLRTTIGLVLSSSSPISIAWGPQHVQIYNDGYWPICGAKHPAAMGMDFSECWASAWPAIGEGFEGALRGETRYFENQWMFLDRLGYLEETCFTFSFSPIRDESGGIAGLLHPVTEVTAALISERRIRTVRDVMSCAASATNVEEALKLAAETMAGFKQDVPFCLFYLVDANGTEARLVGSTAVLPETIAPLRIGLEVESVRGWPMRQAMAENRFIEVDDLAGRFGGFACGPYEEAPRKALLLPIALPGDLRASVVLVAGVSSRLPLNEVYRAFYELLAGTISSSVASAFAYAEQQKRVEAMAEMDRAKTVFFSNVSHEFRTPLTLMLGPLEDELAEWEEPLPLERHERLETVHRNSLRLLKLVNTLLDFSRIEAGRTQARFESTDLAAYTAELASNFRSAIEKGGLQLDVDCAPLPEPVYVDREMWEKIVLNLISNAFKHTFDGSIRVSLSWLGDRVELTVSDTGVGIAEAELPRLFERFHRVANARSRTHEGSGIGLALVAELVKTHGGQLRVESEEGRGSRFFASVKTGRGYLAEESVGAAEATPKRSDSAAYALEAAGWVAGDSSELVDRAPVDDETSPGQPRPRVLWADDNADLRQYVQRLLADKYEVVAVSDGEAAVRVALADPPDLVLTDVMMPGLDGFGVLRALRDDRRTRMIPVILLSARAGEEASVEGIAAGADDYLMKPFSARELMARVGTHLRAARLRQQWQAAIESREQALAKSAESLKRSNEELQQFAYVASHDLQEPLRMVASYTQLLQKRYKGKLDSDADEFIAFAVDGCTRMKGLIQDLLQYSRAGDSESKLAEVSSADALLSALRNLATAIQESGAEVSYDDLPVLITEKMQLAQLFQNLVGNAIKYRAAAPPQVHVSAARQVASQGTFEWVFSVKDNGVGIEAQYFEKVFVLFQRLQGRSEASGTGIGLAICKKIIERLGGRIWVDSEVGVGSTFRFSLPG